MNEDKVKELRNKIIKGIELAYDRMLASKQKDDSELVFIRNGKIVKIRAKDLLNKK